MKAESPEVQAHENRVSLVIISNKQSPVAATKKRTIMISEKERVAF